MGKDSKSTTTDNCDPKKVSVVIVVLTHSRTSHKQKKNKIRKYKKLKTKY
jgi:hypothetical protein